MRLFVGIDISEDIRQRISTYIGDLQHEFPSLGAKWTKPESLHITLKFIGENKQPEKIQTILSGVQASPFEISFHSVGFFTPRSPRVFWAGVEAPKALPSLAINIDSALAKIGIPKDEHDYHPHLTLARTGSGRPHGDKRDRNKPLMYSLRERLEARPQPDFGTMTAREFHLYQSETLPSGPRYTKLARFELKQKQSAADERG